MHVECVEWANERDSGAGPVALSLPSLGLSLRCFFIYNWRFESNQNRVMRSR